MPVDFSIPESGWRPDLYYWLATVNILAYQDYPQFNERVLNAPGPCQFRIIANDPTLVPQITVAVYDTAILIAIHGTRGGWQWAQNVVGTPPTPGNVPGLAHAYFQNVSNTTRGSVARAIADMIGDRRLPILLTGHSLGGAAAQIMAHHFADIYGFPITGVVTFGAPAVGNTSFADAARWPVIRLENTFDPVPYLLSLVTFSWLTPVRRLAWAHFIGYKHSGRGYLLDSTGAVMDSADWIWNTTNWATFQEIYNSQGPIDLVGHYQTRYTLRVRMGLPYDVRQAGSAIDLRVCDEVNAVIFANEASAGFSPVGSVFGDRWNFPQRYHPVAGPIPATPGVAPDPRSLRDLGIQTPYQSPPRCSVLPWVPCCIDDL